MAPMPDPACARAPGSTDAAGDERAAARRPEQLLQIWLSPAFPVGAFAYSHGLERAVERGLVRDLAALVAWLADLAEHGSLRNDLILAAVALRAVAARDGAALADVAALGAALQPSAERHLEATQQGASFIAQIEASWPSPAVAWALAATGPPQARDRGRGPLTYPVAFAIAAAGHGIEPEMALAAFGLAFTGSLVSAAIRLSVIGQTEGQIAIARLVPAVNAAAASAAGATIDDLGSATLNADLMSLQHETQHTRLFRS